MCTVGKTVLVSQQIVTLNLGFVLLVLAHFCFSVSERSNVPGHGCVIYLDNRFVSPAVIGGIVHREHCLKSEVLQEIYFTIDASRCPVIDRAGGVGTQIDVYHRIIHLCFLEFRQ